jgi:xanthine dehydrogenase accessory factor
LSRLDMLQRKGFDDAALSRFKAPAGLIPATRDSATLALSIVAEIIGRYQSLQSRAEAREHARLLADLPGAWD